jgi:hypothetical protein
MADKPVKPIEELLSIVEALDPDKRESEEQPPTDEELAEARSSFVEAARKALEGDSPDIQAGSTIRQAVDRIDAEMVTRKEAREAAKAEAKSLLEGLEPKAQEGDEGSGDGGESGGEGNDGKGDGEGEGEENKPPEASEDKKAEDKPMAKVASLSEAIRRSEKRHDSKPKPDVRSSDVLVASTGPAQGYGLTQDATIQEVAEVFTKYAPQVKRGSAVLIHMDKMYPDDRSLGLSAEENTRLIDGLTSQRALTAAGGICEPLPADFTHPICGDRGRPIRDALPAFRADRGGARFAPSATVADLEGAITVWTSDTDETPGSETKACPRVDCEPEESATVDAIVACLTVGNFQARFNPEFWRSRLDLLMVAHDRIAEQTLYATMVAAATTTLVPVGAGTGTVTDLLRVIDLQVSGLRSRHRLAGTQIRTVLPAWVYAPMRDHLAAQAPAGSADLLEIGDARINQFFTSRGVIPVFSPDIELIGAQGAGQALTAYNTPFNVLTFPEGTYLFLDGGTLDLGTNITDSSLNAVNDRQAFVETFEQVAFRGCEALVTPVAIAEDCLCDGA